MAKGKHALSRRFLGVHTLVVLTVLAMLAALLVLPGKATGSPDPASVVIAGSLQDELGCPGDWQPDCAATDLTYDATDDVWQATFSVPAGSWEYKAVLNGSFDENYGAGGVAGGPNIALSLAVPTDVKFYYDHKTHWITDNINSVIATAVGSFQSELGCSGDWQPDCLRAWLQDPDGDGVYASSTTFIPVGNFEAKIIINEGWDENYGADGVANGANIPFTLTDTCSVDFTYDSVTHVLSIADGPCNTPPVVTVNCGVDSLDVAIIHYNRPAGDYGTTSPDFNTFWGLQVWGDAIDLSEATEWTSPRPFEGEDEFGRFAWIERGGTGSQVNFIIHQGDSKDTPNDRFFDADVNPEIWVNQGDETIYTSQADAQGFVTIHYHRDDGDYGDPTSTDYNDFWGLHLWGLGISPSEITGWPIPKPPTGFDSYGAYWDVYINDSSQPVSFIIHRGDTKDPGPDQSMVPLDDASVWIMAGDSTVYGQRGEAQGYATIHYHRDDGDYGDNSSPDFNDFWGLQVWNGALAPSGWTDPVNWIYLDAFGPVFEVNLIADAPSLAYIVHRGDSKDPGPDQFMVFADTGYELWQLSGDDAACNTPPTADANGPYTVNEGSAVTMDGSGSSDPDVGLVLYEWDFDDDGTFDVSSTGPTAVVTYPDGPANHTVALRVADSAGATDIDTTTVEVYNVAPTATFSDDGPVDEGTSFHLSLASPYDPSSADTAWGFYYSLYCGDGTFTFLGASPTLSCATADNGTRAVIGQIADKDGGVTEYTGTVTINNVAPSVGAIAGVIPAQPIPVGTTVSLSAAFTDPGTADTHTATWAWSGGPTLGTVTQGAGSGSVAGDLTYATAGVFNESVTVTVADDDGGIGTATLDFEVVVYDPSAGFVTGGGWFYSEAGAYADDLFAEGKASFGFVAKYKKGANVPDGNTQFQFKAGDLNFHSTSYDWLIVTGSDFAKFKGSGTINGDIAPNGEMYKSQIWAGDNDPDTFRIKIWYEDGGEIVVYDNGMNQPIDAGSIVIHTKKK